MSRDDATLVWHAELLERLGRAAHCFPVGFASHDDADERITRRSGHNSTSRFRDKKRKPESIESCPPGNGAAIIRPRLLGLRLWALRFATHNQPNHSRPSRFLRSMVAL